MAMSEIYDAAVVDLMLPQMDGLAMIELLRKNKIHTPVIALSAKRSVDDRVKGLESGCDDYLTKPFAFSELLARVQALIRRATDSVQSPQITVNELTLDLYTRNVERAGRQLDLQPREFSLLEYLMRNAGRQISRAMIIEHVWNLTFDTTTNVVDVYINYLRRKVDDGHARKLIHTVRDVYKRQLLS